MGEDGAARKKGQGDDITSFSKVKDEVSMQLPRCIEGVLGKVAEYQAKHVKDWSEEIGQSAIKCLQGLSENFKYIVNVTIMEKKGAGIHTSSATFWDPESDSSVSYKWENKAMICIVQVFGIGL
mmetsp:Transcript_127290/g.271389  ORF Transcript_127290/g.271389 Transcript_127290/m.271389 type:complete len:124 (-) Transcript_127290:67-438(-)